MCIKQHDLFFKIIYFKKTMNMGPLLLDPFISNPTFSKRKIDKPLDSKHKQHKTNNYLI